MNKKFVVFVASGFILMLAIFLIRIAILHKNSQSPQSNVFINSEPEKEGDAPSELPINDSNSPSLKASTEQSSALQILRGESSFSRHFLSDGSICAIDPIYQMNGSQVVVKGEDVPCPMFALVGGRGEIVFEILVGKPITNRTVSELYFADGNLKHEQRLSVSFHRGNQVSFVVQRQEESHIDEFGITISNDPADIRYGNGIKNSRPTIVPTFSCSLKLVQENEIITTEFIDQLPTVPFASSWIAFDVSGNEVQLAGSLVRVLWFSFDPDSGRLRMRP